MCFVECVSFVLIVLHEHDDWTDIYKKERKKKKKVEKLH